MSAADRKHSDLVLSQPDAKNETRHAHIVGAIRSFIIEGMWPPGYHLPIETDLAEQYGVSRMTMNKALAQLAREMRLYSAAWSRAIV